MPHDHPFADHLQHLTTQALASIPRGLTQNSPRPLPRVSRRLTYATSTCWMLLLLAPQRS